MTKMDVRNPGSADQMEEKETEISEGCPLCERIWNAQFDTLAQLQYNCGKEDESYLETEGLYAICDKHLRMFNRVTSASISAKMLRYLIKKSLTEGPERQNGNVFREYERGCPICGYLASVEKEEVRKIAEVPFEQSTGDFVCLDHLKKIIAATYPENKEKILNAYEQSLEMLFDQLKVFESENYYQVAAEVKSSLWRSVEKLTGRK